MNGLGSDGEETGSEAGGSGVKRLKPPADNGHVTAMMGGGGGSMHAAMQGEQGGGGMGGAYMA